LSIKEENGGEKGELEEVEVNDMRKRKMS